MLRIVWALTILFNFTTYEVYGQSPFFCPKETSQRESTKNAPHRVAIFVHGFWGSDESWQQFPNLMKDDPELEGLRVCVASYPTGVIGRKPSIKKIGDWLISEVVQRYEKYDEIYLIGHSMGGLVIQSGIVERLKIGKARDLQNIRHIILFGTPNQGAELASMVKFLGKQLSDLAENSDFVDDLRTQWINKVYNPIIEDGDKNSKVYIPITPVVGLQDTIVNERSAKSFFQNPAPETVPGDHTSMKEPSDRSQLSYLIVSNAIKRKGSANDSPIARKEPVHPIDAAPEELAVDPMFFKYLDPYPILNVGLWQNRASEAVLNTIEIEIMDFEKKPMSGSSQVKFARSLPPSSALTFQQQPLFLRETRFFTIRYQQNL